jgi:anti-sigma B factor antagonist
MLKTKLTEKMTGYFEIGLEGRLDTETYPQLEAVAAKLMANEPRAIRLDMAKLAYISSMGLRVVLKIAKDLRAKQRIFQMTNLQPQIRKVFDIAATLPAESIFVSVEEADAYFDLMQRKALEKDQQKP